MPATFRDLLHLIVGAAQAPQSVAQTVIPGGTDSGAAVGSPAVVQQVQAGAADGADVPGAPSLNFQVQVGGTDSAAAAAQPSVGGGSNYSLRYYGTGASHIDRVRLPLQDSASAASTLINVGATDFTVEAWLNCACANNTSGPGIGDARNSNIFWDHDVWADARGWVCGVTEVSGSLVPCFGLAASDLDWVTIYGTDHIGDGDWHHVALTRIESTGLVSLWVDGQLSASGTYDTGDISFPPGLDPGTGQDNSYLVLGAEKHDAGAEYPSYNGLMDELRISPVNRYSASFAPSTDPLVVDGDTVGLYHFNEGTGTSARNAVTTAASTTGELLVGGDPAGPEWILTALWGDLYSVGSVDSGADLGTPAITQQVQAGGTDSQADVGTAQVNQQVQTGSVDSGAEVGTPLAMSDQSIVPGGTDSGAAVASPQLNRQVQAGGTDGAADVGTPSVVASVQAGGADSAADVGQPTLAQQIQANGADSGAGIGEPGLLSAGVVSTQGTDSGAVVGTPLLLATQIVIPGGTDSGADLGTPGLAQQVQADSADDGADVGSPSLAQQVEANGTDGGAALGTPALVTAQTITAQGVDSAAAVGTPTLITTLLTVTVSLQGRYDLAVLLLAVYQLSVSLEADSANLTASLKGDTL